MTVGWSDTEGDKTVVCCVEDEEYRCGGSKYFETEYMPEDGGVSDALL